MSFNNNMQFPFPGQVQQARPGPYRQPKRQPIRHPIKGYLIYEDAEHMQEGEQGVRLFARQLQRFYASRLDKGIRPLITPEDIENARNLEPNTGPMYFSDGANWPLDWYQHGPDVFLQQLEKFREVMRPQLPPAAPLAMPTAAPACMPTAALACMPAAAPAAAPSAAPDDVPDDVPFAAPNAAPDAATALTNDAGDDILALQALVDYNDFDWGEIFDGEGFPPLQ